MNNKVPFNQLRYGTRFKYREEEDKQVFVRLGHDLVADWDGTLHAVACNRQGLYCFKDDTTPLDTPVCVVENAASTSLNLVECDACPTSGGCVDKCMKAPADGEPQVVGYMQDRSDGEPLITLESHQSYVAELRSKIKDLCKHPSMSFHQVALLEGVLDYVPDGEPVDRAHVAWLQAEVKRLDLEVSAYDYAHDALSRERDALKAELRKTNLTNQDFVSQIRDLQSELTKARELFRSLRLNADPALFSPGQLAAVDAFISNQSAPADKGQGESVACAHGIRAPHACDQCEAQNAVPDYWEDPDTGTCIDQWSKIQGLNGTEAYTIPLYRHAEQPAPVAVLPEKYDDVLLPFLSLMRAELHANARKGDRPGWLQMDRKTAVLEVFYHMGKLHMAVHRNDKACITEYAADVANMCMMLTDVCGCLNSEPKP